MSLADNNTAEHVAKEIERNVALHNNAIWFNDQQWSLIVKALREYAERNPNVA